MTRIGLLSDTHNFLNASIADYFKYCDEVWHAGDFGSIEIPNELLKLKNAESGQPIVFKGVYGNIDGNDIRSIYPQQLIFHCEDVKVLMRHIGGYPPKYNPETKRELLIHQPQLFISGHSHILKISYDEKLHCLHINPGAAGKQGWHKIPTIIRFAIKGSEIKDCEVIELMC